MFTRATVAAALLLASTFALADDKKDPPKPQNELVSDFVDNVGNYKGKTVTFKMTLYSSSETLTIRDRVGDKSVPFDAKDSKNGAKLGMGLDIPKDLKVPAARAGEPVIVTFTCTLGKTDKGNVAVSITRP
jgi:hypothetical protein